MSDLAALTPASAFMHSADELYEDAWITWM